MTAPTSDDAAFAEEAGVDSSTAKAVRDLGRQLDEAWRRGSVEVIKKVVEECESYLTKELAPPAAREVSYVLGNAHSDLHVFSSKDRDEAWSWEHPYLEASILNFRRAIDNEAQTPILKGRACQALTNLGNQLSHIGRLVEAIEVRNRALMIAPHFGMARGNNGRSYVFYAGLEHDPGHQAALLKTAHYHLSVALARPGMLEPHAKAGFEEDKRYVESQVKPAFLRGPPSFGDSSLGDSPEEIAYHKWTLEATLFLNTLNDIGPVSVAAADVLVLPSIVVTDQQGFGSLGFFNQMKQEFVAARFLLYEGTRDRKPHFADHGVKLVNTLDYPAYSIHVERVKAAYRIGYSLFDKIAYFVNDYFRLGLTERAVNFRSVWYTNGERRRGLNPLLEPLRNLPLRALFWVSKDIYESRIDFQGAMDPDARELKAIRDYLEHKYLKVHDELWRSFQAARDLGGPLHDPLSKSVFREDFERTTLRVLRLARAALIYLVLAVHEEERRRATGRTGRVGSLPLDHIEDAWKT